MSSVRLTQPRIRTTLTYDVFGASIMLNDLGQTVVPQVLTITWDGDEFWSATLTGIADLLDIGRVDPVLFTSETGIRLTPWWVLRAINESRPAPDDACCCCDTCEWGGSSDE